MELATIEIRLSGSLANTVTKRNVTPAELTVLRALHGDECIASITWSGKNNMLHAELLDYLRARYKTENSRPLLEKLFPGVSPQLPTTFKEIGYDITEEGEVRSRASLQKKHQDELERKIREAASATGKTVKQVSYDEPEVAVAQG